LIFVLTKKTPEKEHKVEIINYSPYFKKQGESFKVYFQGKHRKKAKFILQTDLLENVENWNFIKQNKQEEKFFKTYNKNTDDISNYYTHILAMPKYKDCFYFDGGYSIDERLILSEKSDYIYPKSNNKYYSIKELRGFWQNIREGNSPQKIELRQGNQEYKLLDSNYKILWTHTNAKRFFFTDKPVIWARNQFNAIGSDNKNEILYLFSLLNSPLTFYVLKKYLKTENEKNFTIAIKSIKNFVRIPKITTENQAIKDVIIEMTEKMLDLEKVVLFDLVDFKGFTIQRFENIEVSDKNLVLTFNNNDYKLPVKGSVDLLKKIIAEKYYDNNLTLNKKEVTLQELKNLEAIDFETQAKIKKEIDDLVFQLYFGKDEEFKNLLNKQ
jgi:hypothetical protein